MGRDVPALQQQNEHVQQLNNEAGELVHISHPEQATPADLMQAKFLLHQALDQLDQMQLHANVASRLNGQMHNRRVDVLLKLAVANVPQGNNAKALDALMYRAMAPVRNGGAWAERRTTNRGRRTTPVPSPCLSDRRPSSAAEDFVLSFELMKRGKLIGAATSGSTGQPLMFNLPDGRW